MKIIRKMNLLFLLLISLWSSTLSADYIQKKDRQRCEAYLDKRETEKAKPYTIKIGQKLTNSSQLNLSSPATLKEKEVICKAMIGSVILHHGRVEEFYKEDIRVYDQRYENHFRALQIINEAAKKLKDNIIHEHIHLTHLDQLYLKGEHHALLTDHFIRWFYETLFFYQSPLTFFTKEASFDWYLAAHEGYVKDRGIRSTVRDEIQDIYDQNGRKIAIVKPREERTNSRDLVNVSSGLQSLKLADIINPTVPITIRRDNTFTIDEWNFTHTLQPFVGFHADQLRDTSANLQRLLSNVRRGLSSSSKRGSFTLTLRDFAHYFEDSDIPAKDRFEDLQEFNNAVDGNNISKLLVFWYLLKVGHLDNDHFLFTLTSQGKLSIICTDYAHIFEKEFGQIPPLFMLKQTTDLLSKDTLKYIEALSSEGSMDVLGSIFPKLGWRQITIAKIQNAFKKHQTIRQVMDELVRSSEESLPSSLKTLETFQSFASQRTTLFDPLEIRPLGEPCHDQREWPFGNLRPGFTQVPIESKMNWSGLYRSYQVRSQFDWVFSVRSVEELEQGQYLRSQIAPGTSMWDRGYMSLDELLGVGYLAIQPDNPDFNVHTIVQRYRTIHQGVGA